MYEWFAGFQAACDVRSCKVRAHGQIWFLGFKMALLGLEVIISKVYIRSTTTIFEKRDIHVFLCICLKSIFRLCYANSTYLDQRGGTECTIIRNFC